MFGFIKAASAVPNARVADCRYNAERILECIEKSAEAQAKLVVFPELSVCCYTCGDLFYQSQLIGDCERAVGYIAEKSAALDIISVIGAPVLVNSRLYNCALVILGGEILGIVPKENLAEGGEYNENRWFTRGGALRGCQDNSVLYCGKRIPFGKIIFKCQNYNHFNFAAEICADLWSIYPPSGFYSLMGATVITNPSAGAAYAGKSVKRSLLIKGQSEKCMCAYVYSGASIGESSADGVFDGQAIIAEQGEITAEAHRFSVENEIIFSEVDLESIVLSRAKSGLFANEVPYPWESRFVEFSFRNEDNILPDVVPAKMPYIPKADTDSFYEDIFNIQTYGLYKRLKHTCIKRPVIGVSGGLDSTLALLVVVNCCDKLELPRKNIIGTTMPGFGTTGSTFANAVSLMEKLGVPVREISIKDACEQHLNDIGHSLEPDAAYENAQARERTQILMDIANMENGLVIGTGDMSELALGWATYGGDHLSMYGVNAGLPKTIVRKLVLWLAENEAFGGEVSAVLHAVLGTPISPELLPAGEGVITQKTEDLIGPYELHDYFIYCAAHKGFSPEKTVFLAERSFSGVYSGAEISKWLGVFYKRFFSQQFKRSCSPDTPQVLKFGLSPRAGFKVPSDASGDGWARNSNKL